MTFKNEDVRVGDVFVAMVSNKLTKVKVDSIDKLPPYKRGSYTKRGCTRFNCTNLATGRQVTIKAASKFRSRAVDTSDVGSEPPNNWHTDTKVKPIWYGSKQEPDSYYDNQREVNLHGALTATLREELLLNTVSELVAEYISQLTRDRVEVQPITVVGNTVFFSAKYKGKNND